MTEADLQATYAKALCALVAFIFQQGDRVRFGEVWRPDSQAAVNAWDEPTCQLAERLCAPYPALHAFALSLANRKGRLGILLSIHRERMAADLIIEKPIPTVAGDGPVPVWRQATKDEIGVYGAKWKSLDPAARWGGDFADPAHFSFTFAGRE